MTCGGGGGGVIVGWFRRRKTIALKKIKRKKHWSKIATSSTTAMASSKSNNIERSEHYINFKRNVALRRITTTIQIPESNSDDSSSNDSVAQRYAELNHTWEFYSDGEEDLQAARKKNTQSQDNDDDSSGRRIPLICFGGTSGRADQFFDLMLSLCPRGFWIMSVDLPRVKSFEEFVLAFEALLQHLRIESCHLL